MMLFNKKLDAAEAKSCGLVTAILPSASFENEIDAIINNMASLPQKVCD